MSYTKTQWRNNQSPAINADNLNHIEQGVYDAHQAIDQLMEAVPTKTSDLTNDGDGGSPFVTISSMEAEGYIDADGLATPTFRAADATSKAVLQQAFGVTANIVVPSSYTSQLLLLLDLEPRTWFCWMNGTEMEFARMSISANPGTSTITLYLRGRTSIATGIMGVDSSWTVTPLASDAEGVAY